MINQFIHKRADCVRIGRQRSRLVCLVRFKGEKVVPGPWLPWSLLQEISYRTDRR